MDIYKNSGKPLILVTNDDGIHHPGLVTLAESMFELGTILVAAPEVDQTSMGRSYPTSLHSGITKRVQLNGRKMGSIESFSISGSPAQVVSHAVLELCPRKPDLCVVGINEGENIGSTITGSGTIGAALEAEAYGIPSIAFSVESSNNSISLSYDWAACLYFARLLSKKILESPNHRWLLNVNIPRDANINTPIRQSFQSSQPYYYFEKPKRNKLSDPTSLQLMRHVDSTTLETGSDIEVMLIRREISVTVLSPTIGNKSLQESLPLSFEDHNA